MEEVFFFFLRNCRERNTDEYRQLKNWVPLSSCFLCMTSARVASEMIENNE